MPETINEKPFLPINFTIGANAKSPIYETASGACLYVAEGPSIAPGGISLKLDENEFFRVSVGDFIRVRRFDKIVIQNNQASPVTGVIHVSADPDFLFMTFPRGI
jgi:hypothetical protein